MISWMLADIGSLTFTYLKLCTIFVYIAVLSDGWDLVW